MINTHGCLHMQRVLQKKKKKIACYNQNKLNQKQDFVNMFEKVNNKDFEFLFSKRFLSVFFICIILFVPSLNFGFPKNI